MSSWHFASDPEEVFMGGADVGGDGSVQWVVWGDNVKPGRELVQNRGTHGRQHQHVDNTAADGTFRVSIEVPPDQAKAEAFLESLGRLCSSLPAAPGARVNFELPIVDSHTDQIQIRWDSSEPAPGHHLRAAMAAMKVGGVKKKKKGAKKKEAKKKGAKKKAGKRNR
jgi:hypothetical protein